MFKSVAIGLVLAGVGYLAYTQIMDIDENGESANSPDLFDYGYQVMDTADSYLSNEEYSGGGDNLAAFLWALRIGEGTASDDGYAILFGGKRFSDFSDHPALLGWPGVMLSLSMSQNAGFTKQVPSTAAGAYQINRPTWRRLKAKLGLPDFSPESQDAAAIELIREKGALADIEAGRVVDAAYKVRKVWASLPGAGYGQSEVAIDRFLSEYADAGGQIV